MKKLTILCTILLMFFTSQFAQAGCGNIVYFDNNNPPSDSGSDDNGDMPEDGENPNLSISSLYLSIYGRDDWNHEINKTLAFGKSFLIDAEAKVRNKSDKEAKEVKIKYKVDHGRNFDKNDTKLADDEVDIDPNSKITKHMGRTTVKLSSDGKSVTVSKGDNSESFPVVNGFCKFYISLEVKNDYDDDISSSYSGDHEYGVVNITVKKYASPRSNEIASETMKFYNSDHGAYFFSVDSEDQYGIPQRYPDWEYHGTSLIAFKSPQKGTVPLYTCWTGSTHEYGILDATYGWQWISSFELIANCSETPWKIFDVYPADGQNRKPVYLMRNANTNSSILSNGESDAYYLRDNHNFLFTDNDPFFWVPVDLPDSVISSQNPSRSDSWNFEIPLPVTIIEETEVATDPLNDESIPQPLINNYLSDIAWIHDYWGNNMSQYDDETMTISVSNFVDGEAKCRSEWFTLFQGDYEINLETSGDFTNAELLIEEKDVNGDISYHSIPFSETGSISTTLNIIGEREISVIIKLKDNGDLTVDDISFTQIMIRADVNGNGKVSVVDVMLIERKVIGFSMHETSWIETPITGDVNCDGIVDNTDADLTMKKSMDFDMSETDWCAGD